MGERKQVVETITMRQLKQIIRSIKSPNYSHSRYRSWCGFGVTSIYHRNRTSPSGVLLEAGAADEIVSPLLRKYRNNSPLSPTEGLC